MVFFAFLFSKRPKNPFDLKEIKYWMPVDQYIGGIEHAIYICYTLVSLRKE